MARNKFKKEQKMDGRTIVLIVAIALLVILGAIALVYYFHGNTSKEQDNSTTTTTSTTSDLFSNLSDPVAKIGNKELSRDDFKKEFDLLLFLNGVPAAAASQIPKMAILNQTIIQTILMDKATSEGYSEDMATTESDFEKVLQANNLDLASFKKNIENESFSYDDFLMFYNEQGTINQYLNDTAFKGLSVSDEEAQEYYNANKNKFEVPEQIKASHILVNSSALAEELIQKLNDGADFAELAKNYSIGPSAPNGGDLGFFAKGQMVPAFEAAAFNLTTIGDYTKSPVKTQFGYHIILLTGRKEAETKTFDDVKDDIKKQLLMQKQNEKLKTFIDGLYADAHVQVFIANDIPAKNQPAMPAN